MKMYTKVYTWVYMFSGVAEDPKCTLGCTIRLKTMTGRLSNRS